MGFTRRFKLAGHLGSGFRYLHALRGGLLLAVVVSTFMGTAKAAVVCTPSGVNTITCTGGDAARVAFATTGVPSGATVHADNYPATMAITGQPAGSTVQTISIRFNGFTAKNTNNGGCTSCGAARDVGIVLESPLTSGVKRNLQVLSHIGVATTSTVSNFTVTLTDGSPALPSSATPWTAGGTFSPTNYDETARDTELNPVYTPTGPSVINVAAPLTPSQTLNGIFGGALVNGTWNVYLADDAGRAALGFGADVSFTSFDLIITYSGASSPSTTTLVPNPTAPFTGGNGSTDVLTATVTAGATGNVTFKDGGVNIACAGGNPASVSSNQATCSTTFATEGVHLLSAVYSGDSTFVTSTGSANIYAKNHATNAGTTYCNAGPITSTGLSDTFSTATAPYPSLIFVGDGVNTDIPNSVSTLSLQLKGFSSSSPAGLRMMLVAPDGIHAYDFYDSAGGAPGASLGNYVFQDGAAQIPQSSYSPGTYGPTAISPPPSNFNPNPPLPAPQAPSSFVYASPAGTATFATAFNGAAAHGGWSLFFHNLGGNGSTASVANGWCLTISPATGHPTTTTVTSSANPFGAFGASTSFTATVASSPTPNQGVVTFTENANPLAGAPNGGVASVVNGVATISTSGLPEGDHTIMASYHDATNTFNDSFGTVAVRIDKATSAPTLSGSTWSFCNTGPITIPLGQLGINDFGPASPNPSNILISNLPGRVSSVTLSMKGLHHVRPQNLQTLLVGPNGVSPPTLAQTFDFFSNGGGINPTAAQDTTFGDAFPTTPLNSPPPPSTGPASYTGTALSYTASPSFSLPSTSAGLQRATNGGAFTFNTGTKTASAGGVYLNTDPIGLWSMYFDQTANATGSGLNGGWCLNIIPTAVTGTGTASHHGPTGSNHMIQGNTTGTVTFSVLNNGNGPTGDPDQAVAHAMTVVGTLPAGLTLGTVPTGSPWNCTANTTTQVTCTNLSAIAQGSTYPALTIPVNVAANAPGSAVISGYTFSGAGMTAGTFASDTITIDPSPLLSLTKAHTGTFTQGLVAVWTLQVTNISATASGATNGSTAVTLTDTLPAGYTVQSTVPGAGWNCSGSTSTTVNCTSTSVVAGAGGQFPLVTVNVNVPSNSALSVTNIAQVFGGGDLTHTNSGNAAPGSDTVTVIAAAGPVITGNPLNTTVCVGVNVSFVASATGTPTPTVQWQLSTDGGATFANIAGATTTTLSLGAATAALNGNRYRAVFTNVSGSATTTNALLTVNTAASVTNPSSASVTAGSNVSFTVTPGGQPTATVQWQVSTDGGVTFTNVAGATAATLTFTTAQSDNGKQFRAVVTNTCGTATSSAATLTVNPAGGGPVITLNPVNQTVPALQVATFTAAATGTPTPTVQWQLSTDGGATFNLIAGATSTTLSFATNGTMNGNKYRAVFTNASGSVTTTAATLTVTKLTPVITWANPADILFGSALGPTQLNASANVAGTLVFTPPIGTVLPVGSGQTLSVTFSPSDTANYNPASASALLNVLPNGGGSPVNLVVTTQLSRDVNSNEVIVTLTVANTGGTIASAAQINVVQIGATATTTPLPVALGSIAAGGQAITTVRLPGTVGTTGTRVVLSVAGTFTGNTFGGNIRVALP